MLIQLKILIVALFTNNYFCLVNAYEDAYLNIKELASKYGHPLEEHNVTTEDGYELTLFRMAMGKNCERNATRMPIILQHGFIISPITWVAAGPDVGLSYLLAKQCYDVWCTGTRGSEYSLGHIKYNWKIDTEYWSFTFDEMGRYDLPAFITYILKYTKQPQVDYVGHSQGGGIFYIMGSERPEFLKRIRVSITMAPATWMWNNKNEFLKSMARHYQPIGFGLNLLGLSRLLGQTSTEQAFLKLTCNLNDVASMLCYIIWKINSGRTDNVYSAKTLATFLGHYPDYASVKSLIHFAQFFNSNVFRRFDYGEKGNIEAYGSSTPPDYNLSEIETPICIMYGNSDQVVNPKDVHNLKTHLGDNVIMFKNIDDEKWNHADFTMNKHISTLLMPLLNECLNDPV